MVDRLHDVIVVGAGIMGSSAAYYIAKYVHILRFISVAGEPYIGGTIQWQLAGPQAASLILWVYAIVLISCHNYTAIGPHDVVLITHVSLTSPPSSRST